MSNWKREGRELVLDECGKTVQTGLFAVGRDGERYEEERVELRVKRAD